MSTRTLPLLLAVVATAAAVLSFEALRGLALLCDFGALSALLPLVVDTGAAAGTVCWLSQTGRARTFGRLLALVLLTGSVAGNAVSHYLGAYQAQPAWWLVVAVSGVAPAVLGAVVHLAVVATQGHTDGSELAADSLDEDLGYVGMVDEHGLSRYWADAPPAGTVPVDRWEPFTTQSDATPVGLPESHRAADLIANGAGRRRLARELDISEHQARALLAASRNGHGGAS